MATPYKRQHYLPAAYLKYFSVDQVNRGRESWVWRFDGQAQRQVRVDSQCANNFHYSKNEAAAVEAIFSATETLYCDCLNKIIADSELSERDCGILLMCMFDFYIRNAVHRNDTGQEEIIAYRRRLGIFYSQILLKKEGLVTNADVHAHILKYWRLEIINTPRGRVLMTSDNPSIWTSIKATRPGLHLLILPITPQKIAVAFDIRHIAYVTKQMSEEDYLTVIDSQIHNAVTSVYASAQFSDENVTAMRQRFSGKESLGCQTNETSWKVALASLPQEFHFSFLRHTPPLL